MAYQTIADLEAKVASLTTSEEKPKRKIVQIAGSDIDLVALCNEGNIYFLSNLGGNRVKYPIPQD